MAFRLSRKPFTVLCSQPNVSLTLAGPSRLQPQCCNTRHLNFAVRGYAVAASRQKQKTPNGKATARNPTVKSASTPKTSTKTTMPGVKGSLNPQRTFDTPASPRVSSPETSQLSGKAQSKPASHLTGGMSYKVPEKKEVLTEEEQMEQLDQIKAMARLFPSADPWGQRVETLGAFPILFMSVGIYLRNMAGLVCIPLSNNSLYPGARIERRTRTGWTLS